MRTVGIEEEFLLVDEQTGDPRPVAIDVLHGPGRMDGLRESMSLEGELQQQMIEAETRPHERLDALGSEVRQLRSHIAHLTRPHHVRPAALGTSPMPTDPEVMPDPRYARMVTQFGLLEREQLTCACHVHVAIESPDEGVAVLDRIRVWLPVLVALSANSPYWQGVDTGYEGYRTQVWGRWPSAGPVEVLGSADAYRRLVSSLIDSGVLLDEGMIYFDARLSAHLPTVEVRVADVCRSAEDAVLVAGLVRALVDTAATQWRAGEQPPPVPAVVVRAASWRASRSGLEGELLDPATFRPRPALEVVQALVDLLAPALRANDDLHLVETALKGLVATGTGAARQRRTFDGTGSLAAVALDAARATTAGC